MMRLAWDYPPYFPLKMLFLFSFCVVFFFFFYNKFLSFLFHSTLQTQKISGTPWLVPMQF